MEAMRRRVVKSKKKGGLFDVVEWRHDTWETIDEGLTPKQALRRVDMPPRQSPKGDP